MNAAPGSALARFQAHAIDRPTDGLSDSWESHLAASRGWVKLSQLTPSLSPTYTFNSF
jgi:hypothetical protein